MGIKHIITLINVHFPTEVLKITEELDLDERYSKETIVICDQRDERAKYM